MSEKPLEERVLEDGSPAYYKTGAAYGAARGVSKAAVSKWKKAGHLVFVVCPKTKRQFIDALASDQQREEIQHPGKVQAEPGPAQQAPSTPLQQAQAAAPKPQAMSQSGRSLANAKVATEVYRAKMARLDYELRAGKLVAAEHVEQVWVRLASRLSSALMQLGTSVSEDANPGNPRQARMAIDDGMRKVLERFSEEFFQDLAAEAAEEEAALERENA